MHKHGRSTANPRFENRRNRIQGWLMQEGWQVTEAHNPDFLWVIIAQNKFGQTILIVQPKAPPDRIEFQAHIVLAEEHLKRLAAMKSQYRNQMWWDLRFELLKLGVDFEGFTEPVRQIRVLQKIYDDGLTKDRFVQRLSLVKAGLLLVIWRLGKTLEVETPFQSHASQFREGDHSVPF